MSLTSRTLRTALALPFAASFACQGEEPLPDDTTLIAVLRDCEPAEGRVCPFAGTGAAGFNGDGLHRLETWFSLPMSIHFSPLGDPVVADWNNHKLRSLGDDDTFTTIMGTSFLGDGDLDQFDLSEGAPGTDVNLNHPTQQRYLPSGILLSASWHTHKLRTWDPFTGMVRVIMGGAYGFTPPETDPPGEWQSAVGAQLNQPRWVEVDSNGDVYVVDMRNERIRKIDMQNYRIATVVGSGKKGFAGTNTGGVDCTSEDALETCMALPDNWNPEPGGAIQLSADETKMYLADSEAHIIRVWDMETGKVTVVAGEPGEAGDAVGSGAEARFHFPSSIALDTATNELFVADTNNHRIKRIDLDTGEVTAFAGTGEATCENDGSLAIFTCPEQGRSGDGGPAEEARFYRPFGVDLDLDGNLVVTDTYNNRYRIVYR